MGEKYFGWEAKSMMLRVHVICEGHTEEMFVNELLMPHLNNKGIAIIPAKIGKPGHKGGNVCLERLLFDLKRRLLSDKTCYCTTLLDYYGLPGNFPGKSDAIKWKESKTKFGAVTEALFIEITKALGHASARFIPYIQCMNLRVYYLARQAF